MAVVISSSASSVACDAVVDLIDSGATSGTLEIIDVSNNVLASMEFSDPAFGSASGGIATASTIATETSAVLTGTASNFRIKNSDDVIILSGSVGTSGEDINLNTTSITQGDQITITSMTVTMPQS